MDCIPASNRIRRIDVMVDRDDGEDDWDEMKKPRDCGNWKRKQTLQL
jgi:hypothetical protein